MAKSDNIDNLISINDKEIHFHDLTNPKVVFDFIEIINELYNSSNKHFVLNFEGSKASIPNVCAPISGMIETLKTQGFSFEFINLSKYLQKLSVNNPLKVTENKKATKNALDKIWRFDSADEIYFLINSFVLNSVHKPKSPGEALTLAVKEGITRDKKIGQGNGLWGLHQIVSENSGILNISSGSAVYSLTNKGYRIYENNPQFLNNKGCIVDFQLDYNKEISISKALGGYEPVNMKIESLEDDFGTIIFILKSKESGVGTRISGEKIRNELINIHKQSGKSITLDFKDLNIVSSSFADELIGKLVTVFGFYAFNNVFKLKNMNTSVQSIVQRSVAQRMIESFDTNRDN